MALLSRETREDVASKKLLEYAGNLDVLERAIKLATERAQGIPDFDELLKAITELRGKGSSG